MAINTAIKTIGLATLIAAAPLANAEDGTISWSKGSTWKGSETPYKIKLGGKIQVNAQYFDQDDDFNRDAILRGGIPTSIAAAGGAWAGTNRAFADGMDVDDLDIWLKGTFYGNTHAGIVLDAQNGTARVDDWYVGISGIPFVGTALLSGEADIAWGIGDGNFYDNSVAYDAGGEDPDLFGIELFNEFMDGKIGYTAAFGMAGGSSTAAFDSNYDLQFELFGVPYENDDMSVMLMGSLYLHNPSGNGHNPFTQMWGLNPGLENGSGLGGVTVLADEVLGVSLSGSVVYGPFMAGVQVSFYDTSTPNDVNTLSAAQLSTFLSTGSIGYTEYNDGSFFDWSINAAYSLTGEKQSHGGGITPKANFAWDGSGYGAFEVVARIAGLDAMDDTANGVVLSATPSFATLAGLGQFDEGVETFEATIGVNWYLNPAWMMGAYITMVNWEYDDGAVTLGSAATGGSLVTGATIPTTFDLSSLYAYSVATGISNDYDVVGFYYSTTVKF